MSLILSLDTSTPVCSVAIHNKGIIVASGSLHVGQSAASKLAILIDDVRKLAGIELKDLNAVAVTSGPGSYTGLRISTSTAKGICYALNIPLIAVGTLELMAHQVNGFNTDAYLCPMIDARRMEVYCYVTDQNLKIKQPVEAKIIDESSFQEYLREHKVLFFGDGAEKCREVIKHENAFFVKNVYPSAAHLGTIAHEKLDRQAVEDLVHFEPFYLKDFVAKKAAPVI